LIKPASGKLDFSCTFQHAGSQAWFTNVYGLGEAVRVLLNHGLVVGGVITGTAPSPDAVSIGARDFDFFTIVTPVSPDVLRRSRAFGAASSKSLS
jgi:hypothetical protein